MIVLGGLVALVMVVLWVGFPLFVNGYLSRRAMSSARFFLFKPTGSQPAVWDVPTSAVSTFLNTLSGKVFSGGGAVLHRYIVDGDIRFGMTIWGVDDHESLVSSFARALGSDFEEGEPDFLLRNKVLLEWKRGVLNQQASPAGDNLNRCAEKVHELLNKSDDMSLHVGLQPLSRGETRAYQRFVDSGKQTTQQVNQVLGSLSRSSVFVLAESVQEGKELGNSIFSQVPNYLFSTKAVKVNDRRHLPLIAFFLFVSVLGGLLVNWVWVLSVLFLLGGVFVASGNSTFRQNAVLRRLECGVVFTPAPGSFTPVDAFKAVLRVMTSPDEGEGQEVVENVSGGLSGWADTTQPLNAGQVVALSMFPGKLFTEGETSGVRVNSAPPAVTNAVGLSLGLDSKDGLVKLPDKDRYEGLFISGDAGSGKTVGLHGVWANDVANKLARKLAYTLIWIETKGEGALDAIRVAREMGASSEDVIVIDMNAGGKIIDLLSHGDPLRSAEVLTEAMRYGFEEGAIMSRAENVLKSAFHVAMSMPVDVRERLKNPSVMEVAFMLLGGNKAKYANLVGFLQKEAFAGGEVDDLDADAPDISTIFDDLGDDFAGAVRGWDEFDRLTDGKRAEQVGTSVARVKELLRQRHIWKPDVSYSIKDLLVSNKIVIINFGAPIKSGEDDDVDSATGKVAGKLAGMFMYMLWDSIARTCSGWNSQGKGVFIYSDELSMIASDGGDSTNVIEQMRDQGRSYGVKLNLATQRIGQLGPQTMASILSFGHKVFLKHSSFDQSEAAIRELTGGDEGSYEPGDIQGLPVGEGIARVTIDGQPQPPFNLRFRLIEDLDRDDILREWGFDSDFE